MEAIRAAWCDFQQYLETDTPPPLSERDTVERTDPVWKLAAGLYVVAKRKAEEAATELDTQRERLVMLATHPSESGFGVSVTRYFKQGNVDYKKVPQLKGVDLDGYRGKRFDNPYRRVAMSDQVKNTSATVNNPPAKAKPVSPIVAHFEPAANVKPISAIVAQFDDLADGILVGVTDTCAIINSSRSKFYRLVNSGELAIVKIGSATNVRVGAIRKLIAGATTEINCEPPRLAKSVKCRSWVATETAVPA